jgi:SAM-dependent methyltransferase
MNSMLVPMNTLYQCPRTRTALKLQGEALRGTGTEYPVRSGVPVFLADPSGADDELAGVKLADLVVQAQAIGWQAALQKLLGHDRGLMDYVTDVSRSRFLELLPLDPESRVLEIGPGLGQITRHLAPRVGSVDALEISEPQSQFVRLSCEQSGLGNVAVACGGDDCRLPYADRSFDLVVLNLVFEWCGGRFPGSHDEAQNRLLEEIHRVLKPGGQLYLSTKNRYGLRLLLGRADEHLYNMRFGSSLPRAWGVAWLRRHGHARARGHLHSFQGLDALLAKAGFGVRRAFWAAPEMRNPDRFVPVDASEIRAARHSAGFRQGNGRLEQFLMSRLPAGWVKYVSHGLATLATKS